MTDLPVVPVRQEIQPNWAEKVIDSIHKALRFSQDARHYMVLTQIESLADEEIFSEGRIHSLLSPFQELPLHVVGVYQPKSTPKDHKAINHIVDSLPGIYFSLLPVSVNCPKSVLLLDDRGSLRVTLRYQDQYYRRIEEVLKLICQLKFTS